MYFLSNSGSTANARRSGNPFCPIGISPASFLLSKMPRGAGGVPTRNDVYGVFAVKLCYSCIEGRQLRAAATATTACQAFPLLSLFRVPFRKHVPEQHRDRGDLRWYR